MKNFKLIFLLTGFLILFSCQDETNVENENPKLFQQKLEPRTLLERDSNYPFSLERKTKSTRALGAESGIISYLGRSYRPTTVPVESPLNFAYRVIDIEKIDKETNYIYNDPVYDSEAFSLAFSEFYSNHLEKYSQNKLTYTASFAYSGCGISYKNEFTKKFTSIYKNERTSVCGEGSILYRARNLTLQSNSANIKRKISRNYMDSLFIEELYNGSLESVIKDYGSGVLKRFITGGRATAMYCGIHEQTLNKTIAEESMKNAINTSLKVSAFEASVGIEWEDELKETQENLKKFTTLKVATKTSGGKPLGGNISAPQDLISFKLDLTPWLNSLNEQNYSIAEVPDSSIEPISEFIEEENYRKIIEYGIGMYTINPTNYYLADAFDTYQEPHICLMVVATLAGEEAFSNQQPIDDLTPEFEEYLGKLGASNDIRLTATAFLVGRHGTMINLGNVSYIEGATLFDDSERLNVMLDNAAITLRKEFGLTILVVHGIAEAILKSSVCGMLITPCFDDYVMPKFKENLIGKMIDKNKNLMYLLYENGKSKYALSLFNSTRSINNYAFKFLDNIKTIPFDNSVLENYRIVGL